MVNCDDNTSTYESVLNVAALDAAIALIKDMKEPFAEFMKEHGADPEEYMMLIPEEFEHNITGKWCGSNVPNYVKFDRNITKIIFLRVKPKVKWRYLDSVNFNTPFLKNPESPIYVTGV